MANKLTRKRYNKLLTARNNYYLYRSQLQKGLPMGLDISTNAYHQYRGTNNLTKMPSTAPSTLDGIKLDTPTLEDTRNAGTSSTGEGGGPNPIASQLLSAGVSAAGNFLGSALSGGMESGAGNIMQGLGSMASTIPGIGTFVGAGLNVLGGITNGLFGSKMNKENIAKVENNIRELNSFQSNASDYDTLAQNWASSPTGMTFDNSFIGKQGKFSHKVDRKADELRRGVDAGKLFVQNTLNNNAANISDAQSRALNSAFIAAYGGPLFADGGSIHIKPENRGKFTETKRRTGKTTEELTHSKNPLTRKRAIFSQNTKKWHHAFGGVLMTHGADFDTGVTLIGNGGTHENNPYEGVPMGVDPEGVPNLVELGEVIFNDYVFSKRLKVPKEMRKKYKLGGKLLTFADAALKISKESEERPNDPISLAGLLALMEDLANVLESIRSKRQGNRFSYGGLVNKYKTGTEHLRTYSNYEPLSKDTDFYTPEYLGFWEYMNNPANKLEALNWLNRINSGEFGEIGGNTFTLDDIQRLSRDFKKGPVHRAYLSASKLYNDLMIKDILLSDLGEVNFADKPKDLLSAGQQAKDKLRRIYVEKTLGKKDWDPEGMDSTAFASSGIDRSKYRSMKDDDGNEYLYLMEDPKLMPAFDNAFRYASIAGSLVGLGTSLFSKPDESGANAILEATRGARTYLPIRFNPIGNYLTYKPFDVEFAATKAGAEAAAARRAILNTSGGNRAQAMAGILAANNNALNLLGMLRRGAAEDNLKLRQMVEDFNRATNMFNSEGFFKADAANQSALAQSRDLTLRGTMAAEESRQRARLAHENAILANLSNLFNSISNIGKERVARDLMLWLINNGFVPGYRAKEDKNNATNTAAKSGKIRRKKKGLTY